MSPAGRQHWRANAIARQIHPATIAKQQTAPIEACPSWATVVCNISRAIPRARARSHHERPWRGAVMACVYKRDTSRRTRARGQPFPPHDSSMSSMSSSQNASIGLHYDSHCVKANAHCFDTLPARFPSSSARYCKRRNRRRQSWTLISQCRFDMVRSNGSGVQGRFAGASRSADTSPSILS